MKSLIITTSVFVLLFSSVTLVFAGGFGVELTSENSGHAGEEGVGVEIYTGTADRVSGFNIGYEFRLSFVNQSAGQKCLMDKPSSDNKGLAHGVCYSDVAGVFAVYPEVHNYTPDEEWHSFIQTERVLVRFEGNSQESGSTLVETPVVDTNQELEKKVQDLESALKEQSSGQDAYEQKTQELEERVATQEKEVSLLRQIVNKIVDFLNTIWPF